MSSFQKVMDLAGRLPLFLLVGAVLLLLLEPVTAGNKFTTIGGGVSGSSQLKAEETRVILFVLAGLLLIGAVLNVVISHKNPLYMNATLWRPSAIIMTVLGVLAIVGAMML